MPRTIAKHQRRETAPSVARITRTERKRQLLIHATQVFAERGYHNTTLELIADIAGVSEVIFAKYFENKAALFRGVLEKVRIRTLERWREETAVLPDPLAKLHAVVESYIGNARRGDGEVGLLLRVLAECDSEEIASPLRAFFIECETFLADIIAEGQQAGVFRRSPNPRVGALQLLNAGLGRAATQPLGLVQYSEIDSLSREVDCLLHGLLKTDV